MSVSTAGFLYVASFILVLNETYCICLCLGGDVIAKRP